MGIWEELGVFVSACLTGVLIAAVYGALRIFRRIWKHSLFWVSVEDFFFWIGCSIYLFTEMHRTCSGRIRWYFVIGLLLGGCGFGSFICKIIKNRIDKSKKTR